VTEPAFQEPVDVTRGLARRATFTGSSLFVVALLIYGLTFLVALVYLQLD
jgi:hypothetical protein